MFSAQTSRALTRRPRWTSRLVAVALAALACGVVGQAPNANADIMIGGYSVGGEIGDAYLGSGGVFKWGAPTAAERAAAQGGRFQTFARDVSFYTHPAVDDGTAHQVGGAIRARWQRAGWERGPLGYPTSNEERAGSGRANEFQGGVICWSKTGGAQIVWGEIQRKWEDAGGARGYYGVPLGGEYRVGSRFAQDFANGTIFWP
ncbi:lysozyme [Gordonia sp. LSe1-13]|uniref:Lysozyme n=1 Tax=Gordonia sesuvii TaxID=3116777 RepID=A0ABU7MJU9_9ACTN|nr:lysozyme [Gordonia sp. LSe1-13]